MRAREQRLLIAADGCLIDKSEIEYREAVDFLRLIKGLLQAEVRRIELTLVKTVVDCRPGNGIAKRNFGVRLVPHEALAGPIVEGGGTALVFEASKREVAVFGRALDRLLGFDVLEDLVVLARNLLIFSSDGAQAGEQEITD